MNKKFYPGIILIFAVMLLYGCNDNVAGEAHKAVSNEPAEAYCGDTICNGAENCQGCANDCGVCPVDNSCTDTDQGVNRLTKGTATGYYKNRPYQKEDICIDSATLLENFCSRNIPLDTKIDCSINGATCINGRCKW